VTTQPDTLARTPSPVEQRLLASAIRLFAEKGFDRTSVQEIVADAGVTKGAMYHYFDSKDDLLAAIYDRILRDQRDRLEQILATHEPVDARLRAAAVDVVLTTIANLDETRIVFQSMHQLRPATQQEVRRDRREYHLRFRTMLEEGQASGVVRSDIDADLVLDYFFGALRHLGVWYRRDGALSAEQVADSYAELLLASARPDAVDRG
jgi:AcrR family transcriptional regulator